MRDRPDNNTVGNTPWVELYVKRGVKRSVCFAEYKDDPDAGQRQPW